MLNDSILQVAIGFIPALLLFLFLGIFSKRNRARYLVFAAVFFAAAGVVGVYRFITLTSSPSAVYSYDELSLVYAVADEGDIALAESMIEDLLSRGSYTPDYTLASARLRAGRGDYEAAEALYQKAARSFPEALQEYRDFLASGASRAAGRPFPHSDNIIANRYYNEMAGYIVYADDMLRAFIDRTDFVRENVEIQSGMLEEFLADHPEFLGNTQVRIARLQLQLLSGNFGDITTSISGDLYYHELMIISDLYLRGFIGQSNFSGEYTPENTAKYEIVYKRLSDILSSGLTFASIEERNAAVERLDSVGMLVSDPALERIREGLLSYATDENAIYAPMAFLQLAKIEHAFGYEARATMYIRRSLDTAGVFEDNEFDTPEFEFDTVTIEENSHRSLRQAAVFVDQVLSDTMFTRLFSSGSADEPNVEESQHTPITTETRTVYGFQPRMLLKNGRVLNVMLRGRGFTPEDVITMTLIDSGTGFKWELSPVFVSSTSVSAMIPAGIDDGVYEAYAMINNAPIELEGGLAVFKQGSEMVTDDGQYQFTEEYVSPLLRLPEHRAAISVKTPDFIIAGITEPDAKLRINGVIIPINEDGTFVYSIKLARGENIIEVTAADWLGSVTAQDVIINMSDESAIAPNLIDESGNILYGYLPLLLSIIVTSVILIVILIICNGFDRAMNRLLYILGASRMISISLGALTLCIVLFFSWQYASVRSSAEGEAFFTIAQESVDRAHRVLNEMDLYGKLPIFFAITFGAFVLAIVVLNLIISAIRKPKEQPVRIAPDARKPSFITSSEITFSVPPELMLNTAEPFVLDLPELESRASLKSETPETIGATDTEILVPEAGVAIDPEAVVPLDAEAVDPGAADAPTPEVNDAADTPTPEVNDAADAPEPEANDAADPVMPDEPDPEIDITDYIEPAKPDMLYVTELEAPYGPGASESAAPDAAETVVLYAAEPETPYSAESETPGGADPDVPDATESGTHAISKPEAEESGITGAADTQTQEP